MKFSASKLVGGLCLLTVVSWLICGYMKYQEVPGARWPFIVGAVLALVALGIAEREWPFSRWFKPAEEVVVPVNRYVPVHREIVFGPPTIGLAAEAALDVPAFQRCGRGVAIQRAMDQVQQPSEVVLVAAKGVRHH